FGGDLVGHGLNPRSRWEGRPVADRMRDGDRKSLLSLPAQFLGLSNPAVDAAGQTDFFAHFIGGGRAQSGTFPEVENAEVIELLLDCRRDAMQLLEVIRNAAGARQTLEPEPTISLLRRNVLDYRRFSRADVDPHFALRARDPIDRGFGDQVAIQR